MICFDDAKMYTIFVSSKEIYSITAIVFLDNEFTVYKILCGIGGGG